jgi:hypothetical protein
MSLSEAGPPLWEQGSDFEVPRPDFSGLFGNGVGDSAQPSPDFSLFCCGVREPSIGGVGLDFDGGQCVLTQPTVKIRAFLATAWLALRLATKTVRIRASAPPERWCRGMMTMDNP